MPLPTSIIEREVDPGNLECAPHEQGDTIRFSNSAQKQFLNDWSWIDTRSGPYQYQGKLYGVFLDSISNAIEVWASTDGINWSELDPGGHPSCGANQDVPVFVLGSKDTGDAGPPFLRQEYGWENFAVAAHADLTTEPTLFVAYINPDYNLAYAEFDLVTETWGNIKVGPDPLANCTQFLMRPIMGLEYRPASDTCLLVWARSNGDNEAIAGIAVNRSSGFGSEFGIAGNTTPALLHGTVLDAGGRVHVWWRGPSTDRGIFVRSIEDNLTQNSIQKIVNVTGPSTNLIFGGQGRRLADDTLIMGYWQRRNEPFQPTEFRIGALTAPSGATPSWTDAEVVAYTTDSCFYPVPAEALDGSVYMFYYSSPGGGGQASQIDYSAKGLSTYGARTTLVDLTNAKLACGETFWDSLCVQPQSGIVTGGQVLGMFFDRGLASYDPDDIQDPRGARYGHSLHVWYWGESIFGGNLYVVGPSLWEPAIG